MRERGAQVMVLSSTVAGEREVGRGVVGLVEEPGVVADMERGCKPETGWLLRLAFGEAWGQRWA